MCACVCVCGGGGGGEMQERITSGGKLFMQQRRIKFPQLYGSVWKHTFCASMLCTKKEKVDDQGLLVASIPRKHF